MLTDGEKEPNFEGLSSLDILENMCWAFTQSQAIFVAAKLDIADLLGTGAKNCDQLAQATGINKRYLAPLMQILVSIDVFSMDEHDNFKLSPIGTHLQTENPDSLRSLVLLMGDVFYPLWGNLLHAVKTDNNAFHDTFQTSMYGYFAENFEAAKNFDEYMKQTTKQWLFPILEAYDFSKLKTVVDVGGGTGTLIAAILQANPELQGILIDQEDFVARARKVLSDAGVIDRCQIIGGNFFESIPASGNLYLISRVLLNWDDSHAIKILNKCYQAMTYEDKLLIVDFILPTGKTSPLLSIASIELFLMGSSFMRTEDEFRNLLSSASFQVMEIIEIKYPVHAIEARIKQ